MTVKVEEMNRKLEQELKSILLPQLMSHPLMMFYCPEKKLREVFISQYLDYYLYSWAKYGELYVSEDRRTAASLVSLGAFEYKFSGRNAMRLRLNKNAHRIFMHRKIVESITEVVIPDNIEARVLTLYGTHSAKLNDAGTLIRELKAHAEEKGFAIVYETFSKRLLPFMQQEGFEVSYQKQFVDTQFIQTVMTYNI